MDWTKSEDAVLLEAGKNGGAYLESIDRFDLRTLSKDEWLQFLRSVVGRVAELRADVVKGLDDEIPF
jgi:hypothetical protein